MKTNKVKTIVGINGFLVIRFFDNQGKLREKKTDLSDTAQNRSKLKKGISEFEKWLSEQAKVAEANEKIKAEKANTPMDFGYYADKYLQQLVSTKHSKIVAYTYRLGHMKSYFGTDRDITTISELEIEDFFEKLTCSRTTKKDWLVVMRGVFEKARKGNAIRKNIMAGFKLPPESSICNEEAVEPFAPDEIRSLLLHSKDSVLHNYLGIAFHLGTRPEETIALKIEDIDLDNGTVRIERAITKGQLKSTKTKSSKRTLPLPNQAKVFFENQIIEAKRKKSHFLFSKADGKRLDDIEDLRGKKNRNGEWYQLLERAEVPERKLMQTRHTFAVQAIKSGSYTLQEIASMLGHTSLEMLFSHYGKFLGNSHLNIPRSVDIFNGLGGFLGGLEKNEVKRIAS